MAGTLRYGAGASMCSPEESSLSYSPCLCLFLGSGGTLLGIRARLGFAAGTGCGQGGGGLGPGLQPRGGALPRRGPLLGGRVRLLLANTSFLDIILLGWNLAQD